MVLRLNGVDALLPGNDRDCEIHIWKAAAEQGIAPPLLYADVAGGYLVSSYIDNSLSPRSLHNKTTIDCVFDLLERCHRLDLDVARIDYVNHIERYWQILERNNEVYTPDLYQQRRAMRSLLEEILGSGSQSGLCHHDPVVANFVGKPDSLFLVDWEYAARGLLVMDYAALGVEWRIDDPLIIARTGIEPELLTMAKSLYGYMCELWTLISDDAEY